MLICKYIEDEDNLVKIDFSFLHPDDARNLVLEFNQASQRQTLIKTDEISVLSKPFTYLPADEIDPKIRKRDWLDEQAWAGSHYEGQMMPTDENYGEEIRRVAKSILRKSNPMTYTTYIHKNVMYSLLLENKSNKNRVYYFGTGKLSELEKLSGNDRQIVIKINSKTNSHRVYSSNGSELYDTTFEKLKQMLGFPSFGK